MRTIRTKLFFTSLILLALLAEVSLANSPPSFPGAFPSEESLSAPELEESTAQPQVMPPPKAASDTIVPKTTIGMPDKPLTIESKAPSIAPPITGMPQKISKPELLPRDHDEIDDESDDLYELEEDSSTPPEPEVAVPEIPEDENTDGNKAPDKMTESAPEKDIKAEDDVDSLLDVDDDALYEDEAELEKREKMEKKREELLKKQEEERARKEAEEKTTKTEDLAEEQNAESKDYYQKENNNDSNAIMKKTDDGRVLAIDPFAEKKEKATIKKKKEKTAKKDDSKEKIKKAEKGDSPSPVKRPRNYKETNVPLSINKKQYSKENLHLPQVRYIKEYKELLFQSIPAGNLNALRAMIDYFKDVEIKDEEGNTPLIFAVMSENLASTISLLGMGANPNAQNKYGVSPLHVAAQISATDYVSALINRGADVNIKDENGETPLMIAAQKDNINIVEILVKQGADINAKMKNGNTALHFAAKNGSENAAYLLLTYGAETDPENYKGYTPLMEAALVNNTVVPSLLIKAGASTTKQDITGKTPTQIASQSGYKEVAEVIDSANIRRELKLDEMLKQRKREERAFIPINDSDRNVKSTLMPELKPIIAKSSDKMIPMPHFTKEEEEHMLKNAPIPMESNK